MMTVARRVQGGKEHEKSEGWGWKERALPKDDMHMNKRG